MTGTLESDTLMALAPVPELSVLDLDVPDWRAALVELGRRAEGSGHAQAGFADALIERELRSPTGLPTAVPVAIPHGEPGLVNRSGIALARLARPLPWHEMGAADNTIEVRAVLVLLVAQAHSQVQVLSRLMQVLQRDQWFTDLAAATDVEQACAGLQQALQGDDA